MCKFGNKIVLNTVAVLVEFVFDFPIFSIYRKWEFSIFLKIVSAKFWVSSHTLSNSFRLCKFKK